MRSILLAGLALLVVIAQGTWLTRLGLPLDAPLLLTLATAWWGGRSAATAMGFWCGALVGAMTGTSIAFAALYALVGWSAATLVRKRRLGLAFLLGAGATLCFQGLESLMWSLAQHPPQIDPGALLAQVLWNGLALVLLVWSGKKLGVGRSEPWKDWRPLAYGD